MTVPARVTFVTKRHSRRPWLRLSIKDADGNPFDFTGATGVRFLMYDTEGVAKVSADGAIEDPVTDGVLRYQWAVGDLDTAGEYHAEFDVSYAPDEHMTLPLDGVILVRVFPDVDDA